MPAVHPQDFSVMAVLQPQKTIHGFILAGDLCAPTTTS